MSSKLVNRSYIKPWLLLIFSTAVSIFLEAQERPPVIFKMKEYESQVEKDSTKRMIELKSRIPGIVYDLRYATTNNFMHRRMYPENTTLTYLRLPVANALANVQEELNKSGRGLKIFDAYRPYSVTVKFWELVKDERYVANPAKGSGHNRGIAVDLTIINLKDGSELNMGTGFDNFSDTAHHDFNQLSKEVLENRKLIRTTMEKWGFRLFESEWWHYFWPEVNRYEILDIDFKKLRKTIR
jgi:D-alanyl-D-alanine dipeptidase